MKNETLSFGLPNAKLKKLAERLKLKLKTFSIPSGWTCPAALECLSKFPRNGGKGDLKDGPHTKFRCFQASAEALYPSLRKMVWKNFDILKSSKGDDLELADLIQRMLPDKYDIIRIHVGGDFFNQKYFDAWLEVARRLPEKIFYAYTKSLPYWIKRLDEIPENFVLTASRGGKHDELINSHNLKCAEVVFSEKEAVEKGLEIDHDDWHAAFGKESFALLIHGVQPKGSKASKALQKLKKKGFKGYNKKVTLKQLNELSD